MRELLSNLLVNNVPKGHIPKSTLDGPLIIDADMIRRMETDKDFANRLAGWKWATVWTSDAVSLIMKREGEQL